MSQDLKIITFLFIVIMFGMFLIFGDKEKARESSTEISKKITDIKENVTDKINKPDSDKISPPEPKAETEPRAKPDTDLSEGYEQRNLVARGRIRIDGVDLCEITDKKVELSIASRDKNNNERKYSYSNAQYENCILKVYDLNEGYHVLNISVDYNEDNPPDYPGDFTAQRRFETGQGRLTHLNIQIKRFFHLIMPENNSMELSSPEEVCTEKETLSSPVRFEWKSMGEGITYHYTIRKGVCNPYSLDELVTRDSTTESYFIADLEPSLANEFYSVEIDARRITDKKNNVYDLIGELRIHFDNGYGWMYRFRIE